MLKSVCVGILLSVAAADASDWTQWRGPNRDATSNASQVPPLAPASFCIAVDAPEAVGARLSASQVPPFDPPEDGVGVGVGVGAGVAEPSSVKMSAEST